MGKNLRAAFGPLSFRDNDRLGLTLVVAGLTTAVVATVLGSEPGLAPVALLLLSVAATLWLIGCIAVGVRLALDGTRTHEDQTVSD